MKVSMSREGEHVVVKVSMSREGEHVVVKVTEHVFLS